MSHNIARTRAYSSGLACFTSLGGVARIIRVIRIRRHGDQDSEDEIRAQRGLEEEQGERR